MPYAASALHRFALVRRGGYEYKLFSLTYPLIAYSASRRPLPLVVRPLALVRVRLCPLPLLVVVFGGCTPS